MKDLLYYSPGVATHSDDFDLPGIEKYAHLFGKIFLHHMAVVDRTGTLSIPIRVKSLFPIPEFRALKKTYEEICNERALELLRHADSLGMTMYVSWSGGIDSTLVLVSLLKNATAVQKKNIVVLLSEESIAENPKFYEDHVRKNLRRASSSIFPYLLGSQHLFVNGELNDQLFGAQAPGELMGLYGDAIIHQRYRREVLFKYLMRGVRDAAITNFYLNLFERVIHAAPMPIVSYVDYFWWLNFALKWQSVALRVLPFTARRNAKNLSPEYVRDHFIPFYGTDDFQLWSMNNLDKRIKDTWATYKWPCKDIIYDFTKDANYRDNKLKKGSLYFLLIQQSAYNFMDDSYRLYDRLDAHEYYNPVNDFT